MSDKPRFAWANAAPIATEIARALKPACERICIAGSLRRGKATVGDVEIVYVPKFEERNVDLFFTKFYSLTDDVIARLMAAGTLAKRKNVNGSEVYGQRNKLMLHPASGIPVDLFATTAEAWFNYLVCRTGPAEQNTLIAMKAQARGWKWHPYKEGFTRDGLLEWVGSEKAVFDFVGLPMPKRVEIPI